MNNNGAIKNGTKAMALLVMCLVIVSGCILFYFILTDPCCETETEEFGDTMINGTYTADAFAITLEGHITGEGIETAADPPTIVFEDDFEGTSPWDVEDDVDVDETTVQYWGSESAYFDPSVDDLANLSVDVSPDIGVDADESIEVYFYINASTTWDSGDDDYFILEINFTDGKSIVYEILGTYSTTDSNVAVISVSTQVTATGMWVGINIENIDEDYLVQFSSSLPIPDIDHVSFVLESDESEDVYLDELQMATLPKPFDGDFFWKKIPSDEKVSSYFVEVDYRIEIDGDVDPTSVHAEFKLWIMIFSDETTTLLLLDKTLVQNEILANVDPEVDDTWMSKVFSLPDDDTLFGDELYYKFFIKIEAWGELISDPGTFVYASTTNEDIAFDTLHFEYIEVDGSIDIIITTLAVLVPTGVGGSIFGILAVKKRRKKGLNVDMRMNEKEGIWN